jgi:hypothetical protein
VHKNIVGEVSSSTGRRLAWASARPFVLLAFALVLPPVRVRIR